MKKGAGEQLMAESIIVNKWGNSLAIRIPKYVERNLGIHVGDRIKLYYKDNIVLLEVEKDNNQKFDEWLELFNRGEAKVEDMPTL